MNNNKLCCAVDIESAGRQGPIVSIGLVIGTVETVIHKERINVQVRWPTERVMLFHDVTASLEDYGDFEPRCWVEFWAKLPRTTIELLQKDALLPVDAKKRFRQIIQEYCPGEVTYLTDAPAFDIGLLNRWLSSMGTWQLPFSPDCQEYNSIYDPCDMLKMTPSWWPKLNKNLIHDHDPVNDALYMLLSYRLVEQWQNVKDTLNR